jgi:hypothetical protein
LPASFEFGAEVSLASEGFPSGWTSLKLNCLDKASLKRQFPDADAKAQVIQS